MNKLIFKKTLCFTIALLMLVPIIPNFANAASSESTLSPGTVALTKEASWVDYDNRIAEVKFTVKGEPVKTAVDIVLVIDRSGSMGFGGDSRYSPCTNSDHYIDGHHKNDIGTAWYDESHGCNNRMIDAKNASKVLLNNVLDNNVIDEFGNKNRVALVPFNSGVSSTNSNDFTDVKSTLETKINNLSANDGTDYTDALTKARDYIKNRNKSEGLKQENVNSRPTYIVMLSDGKPDPSDRDGKNIADNLKTFTGEPLTIFSLGLNMLDNDSDVLKYIATNGGAGGYYKDVTNTGTDLQPIIEHITSLMKPAGKNATLEDVISKYFDYYEDGTYKPNQTIAQSGKNVTWNIGTITKNEIVLTFYVQLREEYNISGTYPTNDSASLTYTPVGNNPGSKEAQSPNLSVTTGSITINYLLVDEDTGKYIAEDGNLTDDIAFAKRVDGKVLSDLEIETHVVTPEAPTGYLIYGDGNSVNITLTESEKDKTVNFKVYEIKAETYDYTINYFIEETETKVPGINPNPVMGEGIADEVIEIPHPTVPGYTVLDNQPTTLTITTEGATVTIYYSEDEVKFLDYVVEYYVDGEPLETTEGKVPVFNPVVEYVSTENRPDGYIISYDSTKFPFTVTEENNVIRIYYINESGNSTIDYIVQYYIDDSETPFDTVKGSVSSETPFVNSVSYENMPPGYHVGEEYSTKLPFKVNVESENIIKVYYVKNDVPEPVENMITINHYTKIGSGSEVLAKTETKQNPVTTGSSIVYGADYKNAGIIGEGFEFVSSTPESLLVYANSSTESAISAYIFNLHYYKSGGGGGDGDGGGGKKPPVIINDTVVPLAELEKVDHFAYIIGYPEGDIRPNSNITREEVAMIFYRLMTDESRNEYLSDVNSFTDLEAHGWSNRAISTLYKADIIKGYPDGTFRPSEPITRAEFATIAAKFDKLELQNTSKFTDIFGHWAEKYITSSEIKGWIKGYPDNTFKPEQDITRAEAMTLINNVLERLVPEENIHPDAMFWPDIKSDDWYYEAVMEATNSHDYIYEEDKDELWTGMKLNKVWP